MKPSNLNFIIILIMALLAMGWQCDKRDFVQPKWDYEFAEKLTLTPFKKAYAGGDTIWIEFSTSNKNLFDKLTSSRIPTDTTFLNAIFYYHRRFPVNGTQEYFSSANVDGGIDVSLTTMYSWYNVLTFKTSCSDNRYFFKIAFVPTRSGIYSIEPGLMLSYCPNKVLAQNASLEFTFDLADCNKDVYLSIPPVSRGTTVPGQIEKEIDNKKMFVFRVL